MASLASRISDLATRTGQECKALWAAKRDKVAAQNDVTLRAPVYSWYQSVVSSTDKLVVETTLPFTGPMSHFRITISTLTYGHVDGQLSLYHYAASGGTIYNPRWVTVGDMDVSLQLAKTGTNNLVLIFDKNGTWDYIRLTIWELQTAYATYSDANFTGWSASLMTDAAVATAYSTTMVNATERRVVQELDGKAATVHTHTAANVTDFSTAADARISAAVGVSVQAYNAALTSWAAKAVPSGTPVGTTDSQTLTNKTIALGSNTVSGTMAQLNTAVTDGDVSFVGHTHSASQVTDFSTAADTRADGRISAAIGVSVQAYNAALTSWAAKAVPAGVVVGTTDTQTLTNKTMALGSNTVSGTMTQFNAAVTDGDFSYSGHTHDRLTVTTDDRSTATVPDDYNDVFLVRFRSTATLGIPSSSAYAQVVGFRAWGDSSGGEAHETAYCGDGVWTRRGATTTWSPWYEVATGQSFLESSPNLFRNGSFNVDKTFTSTALMTITYPAYGLVPGSAQTNVASSGRCVKMTRTAAGDAYALSAIDIPAAVNGLPITVSYTARASGTFTAGLDMQTNGGTGTYKSSGTTVTPTAQRLSYTWTPNGSPNTTDWHLVFRSGPNANDWVEYDDVQVEIGTMPTPFRLAPEDSGNTVTVVYTTTVPTRPAADKVIWQGQVDPAANSLAGDMWLPT